MIHRSREYQAQDGHRMKGGHGRPEQAVTLSGSNGLEHGVEPTGSGHYLLCIRARFGDKQNECMASGAGDGRAVALKGRVHPA